MKFKSWVEMHVGRPRRKKEKQTQPKTKSSDLSVTLPPRSQLDSAGNSPTSPQQPPRNSLLRPPSDDDLNDLSPKHFFHVQNVSPAISYLSPFRMGARGNCACSLSSGFLPTSFPCTCYPEDPSFWAFDEYRRLHSIRTSVCAAQLNSPRQRSHIRTNPWLTPKSSPGVSFRVSSSSSDCGSSEKEASIFVGSEDVVSPSSSNYSKNSFTDEGGCSGYSDATPSSDDVSLVSPEVGDSSDTDECETLNELGQFDENYEYERETDILDDDEDEKFKRKLSRDEGNRTPTVDLLQFIDGGDDRKPLTSNIVVEDEDEEDTTNGENSYISCKSDVSNSSNTTITSYTSMTSNESKNNSDSRRTLGEIRESLEEKVRRLRLERLIVEDKIREARDEERLRREEKIKFQKQLILHRRQILLRTLQNLREKLEDQSSRLQDAYSATLEMQLQVRRQLKNRNPQILQSSNHEAPF